MGRVTIDGDEWDMGKEARYGIDIGYDEDDEEEMMEWDNEFMEGLDIGNITSDLDDEWWWGRMMKDLKRMRNE